MQLLHTALSQLGVYHPLSWRRARVILDSTCLPALTSVPEAPSMTSPCNKNEFWIMIATLVWHPQKCRTIHRRYRIWTFLDSHDMDYLFWENRLKCIWKRFARISIGFSDCLNGVRIVLHRQSGSKMTSIRYLEKYRCGKAIGISLLNLRKFGV